MIVHIVSKKQGAGNMSEKNKNNNAKSTIMVCLIGAVVLMSVLGVFSSIGIFIRYQRDNDMWW